MNRFSFLKNSRNRMLVLCVVDICTIILHSFLSIILRYEMKYDWVPLEYVHNIKAYLTINIITTIIIFFILNLYNSVWSFAGLHELIMIGFACFLSTVCQAFGMQLFAYSIPRSFHVFYFFLLLITTVGTRFSYRILNVLRAKIRRPEGHVYRTLVIGAGEAGSTIIQELKHSAHLNNKVVGVIDDNPNKKGKLIQGVRIFGGRDMIVKTVEKYGVDEIILAIPSVSPKTTREILQICNQTDCKMKILPGMYQLINEEISVSKLRDVSIEDLLGRDTIQIDTDSILDHLSDKTILVTGGGGSIGSELCRQIAACTPRRLIIFDIYENNVYDIQQELKRKYPNLNLKVLIGSVRNTKRIEKVMERYHPDIVYHAAAHKHVPLMEDSPNEAIKNNVFGTYKTARAADKYGVKKFVLISTDKAVNPTNIMGASKRLCEMIVQLFSRHSQTEFAAVRFGNVLGSNGSVIPLFKKQMEEGGPVTVTHPDIIRYFMTISEAVSLVLQAGAYAKGGEIFVFDMGEPVKIADLAKNLIRLSGYTLGVDMDIRYIGLRPGEKLYEEILIGEEGMQKTANDLIYIGKPLEFDEDAFLKSLKELEIAVTDETFDVKEIVAKIVKNYNIRPEDKRRDESIRKELYDLGKASHEDPAVEEL